MTLPTSSAATRRSRPQGLARVLTNLTRFPQRTATTLSRLFDPNFRLERQANSAVRRWFTPQRRKQLENIPGMSATHECRLLAYLAAEAPAGGDIVEIGAWKGKTTAWLVEGARRRADLPAVVTIDPHERNSWEDFSGTVQRFDLVGRGLQIHRARSHDVGENWQRPISLLWIDGSHEYEAVLADIDDFVPHVMPGGWVIFDDAAGGTFPGVERAIDQRMRNRRGFTHAASIRHLELFRRDAR